jgi:FkbM family methyltransferase
MSIYLGNNLALTKTIYGHKIYVDTRDMSLTPHILLDGCWEPWIVNVFRNTVEPNMNVIDIGANIGYYSLLAADAIGPNGKLVSFEANAEIADILYRNLAINGFSDRSEVVSKAVYSRTDTLKFGIFERYQGGSSLYATPEHGEQLRDAVKIVEVEAISLDEFCEPGSRIEFLKIDAEGAESRIFDGARRVITENRQLQILMEYAPALIESEGGSVEEFYKKIASFGFRVFRIAYDSTLVESSFDDLAAVPHCDVLLRR